MPPPPQPTSLEVLGREVSGLRDGGAEQFRGFSHTSPTPTPNWPVRCRREGSIETLLVTVNVPKQGSRLPVGGEGGGVGGGDVLAGGLLLDLAGGCGGAGAAAVASPALWFLVEKNPPRKQMLGSRPPPPVDDTVDTLRHKVSP